MVLLALVHPGGHSCLQREGLRAYQDQKRRGSSPKELTVSLSIQSKVGLSREAIHFLVQWQNLKSASHLFYSLSLSLSLFNVSLCLNSGYAFWQGIPKVHII